MIYLLNTAEFSLPLQKPVLIFSVVLFVILFSPIILSKFKIPSIIGLIIAGVALGPNGLHILENDSSFKLFGFVGLLYIMFMAGLELDMGEFKKNRNKSIVFGILTFAIPLSIGIVVCYHYLGYALMPSILIASMFSTHTLVGYPIASRLGITRNPAVNIAVGGTIITDTAVLLILSVITGAQTGQLDAVFWSRLGISLAIFVFVVFWAFPRIARWFFKNIKDDKTSHYIFVLAMVFLAGFLVELASIEPIVGAFMAGLALNRLIPHTSALMNRIEFVGNALFIPFFLISVGMLVDLRILLSGPNALILSGILISVALVSKWLAALGVQLMFGFSATQRKVIFGLSSAHAAATLAIIKAGFDNGMIDAAVLNGTILLILITCLVASFVTENAGRKLALKETEFLPVSSEINEKILVPLSNPAYMEHLLDLAIMLKRPKSKEPIYSLMVVDEDEQDNEQKILLSNRIMDKVVSYASASENHISSICRVDMNASNGILHTIQEENITELILEWQDKTSINDRIFGTDINVMLANTEKMILVSHIIQPLSTIKKIYVVIPKNAEYEVGFTLWVRKLKQMGKISGAKLLFYACSNTIEKIKEQLDNPGSSQVEFKKFELLEEFLDMSKAVNTDDMIVMIGARKGTLSYQTGLDVLPNQLSKYFQVNSFILLYPEQNAADTLDPSFRPEDIDVSHIQENIERIGKIGKSVGKIFKNKG